MNEPMRAVFYPVLHNVPIDKSSMKQQHYLLRFIRGQIKCNKFGCIQFSYFTALLCNRQLAIYIVIHILALAVCNRQLAIYNLLFIVGALERRNQ